MISPSYSGVEITLYSPYLEDLTGVASVDLSFTINCCETTYTAEIDLGDISAGSFTIDAEVLYGFTVSLDDGIYSFVIKITYDDDTVRKEKGCLFVDNTTSCKVAEFVEGAPNLEIEMDLFILSHASQCGCECSSFCQILERLWKAIGLIDCDLCDATIKCTSCS